jgi:alpha-beta hydrolase superfamily lysophospholipase
LLIVNVAATSRLPEIPPMPSRRFLRWATLAAATGLLLLAGAVRLLAGQLLAPANSVVGPPPANFPATSLTLETAEGTPVAAWHLTAPDSSATVLLLHPVRGSRLTMVSRAKLLLRHGFAVLLIDLQAHGETPGEMITLGSRERHDVAAAIAYIRRENQKHRIGVVGRSLGGAAALLGSPLGIDALVLESVFPTVEEAVYDRLQMRLGPLAGVVAPLLLWQVEPRLGIPCSELRPIDRVAAAGCPVLVISGTEDQHTTIAETHRLFEAAAEPKELIEFAGAAHGDLLAADSALYEENVIRFLRHWLRPTGDSRAEGGE